MFEVVLVVVFVVACCGCVIVLVCKWFWLRVCGCMLWLCVRVPDCPLRSGACVLVVRLRSGSAHCDLALAVEISGGAHCDLALLLRSGSGACC